MCGCFELKAKARALTKYFQHLRLNPSEMPWAAELHPRDWVLMLTAGDRGHVASRARWGLVGSFLSDEPQIPVSILRSEGLASMPFYGKILRGKRCLIPATAFFAWPVAAGAKQKQRISQPQGDILLFAGVFDQHPRAGTTCAILTTSAKAALGAAHERMPVILSREAAAFWLEDFPEFPAAELALLLADPAPGALKLEPVAEPEESPQLAFKFA
ncbi:MAG: hypothetical protein H6R15_4197 [Proteobacteria bacterium]|nr:hypothetical protein [Pseudomonadota bacterium]